MSKKDKGGNELSAVTPSSELSAAKILTSREQELDEAFARVPPGTVLPPNEQSPRSVSALPRTTLFGRARTSGITDFPETNTLLRALMAHWGIFTATRIISTRIMVTPWNFSSRMRDGQGDIDQLLFLIDFFSTPNKNETWPTLVQRTVARLLTVGRAYWEVQYNLAGDPASFFLVDGNVIEKRDSHGEWEMPALIQKVRGESVEFNVGEFMAFRNPTPITEVGGQSMLEPLLDFITADILANNWNKTFLRQASSPQGAISLPSGLSDDELRRNKAEVERAYEGSRNAGSPFMALIGDFNYTPFPRPEYDYQFLEGRAKNLEAIAAVYGVPVSMLKQELISPAEERQLVEHGLNPVFASLECGINEFMQLVGVDGGWEFFFQPAQPADERAMARKADVGARHGGLTINEFRKMLDPRLKEVEGGDVLITPAVVLRERAKVEQPGGNTPDKIEPTPRIPADDDEDRLGQRLMLEEEAEQEIADDAILQAYLAKRTKKEQECISRKIKKIKAEGKSQKQAVAQAIAQCTRDSKNSSDCGCGPGGTRLQDVDGMKSPHQHTEEWPFGILCDEDGDISDEVSGEPHAHTDEFPRGINLDGEEHSQPHIHTDGMPCGEPAPEEDITVDSSNSLSRKAAQPYEVDVRPRLTVPLAEFKKAYSAKLEKITDELTDKLRARHRRSNAKIEEFVSDAVESNVLTLPMVDLMKSAWMSGAQAVIDEQPEAGPISQVPPAEWEALKARAAECSEVAMRDYRDAVVVPTLSLMRKEPKHELADYIRGALRDEAWLREQQAVELAQTQFVEGAQFALRQHRARKLQATKK